MELNQALFVVLTISLVVFLVASIVVGVLFAGLIIILKRLALKAEAATDNLNEAAKAWGRRAAPAAFSALLATALKQWRKSKQKGGLYD